MIRQYVDVSYSDFPNIKSQQVVEITMTTPSYKDNYYMITYNEQHRPYYSTDAKTTSLATDNLHWVSK